MTTNLILIAILIAILVWWYHYRKWLNFTKAADQIMAIAIDQLHYDGVVTMSLDDVHVAAMRICNKKIALSSARAISLLIAEYFMKHTTCKVQLNMRGDIAIKAS